MWEVDISYIMPTYFLCNCIFFFNDTATTEIYTLSLHDALPIWGAPGDFTNQDSQKTHSKPLPPVIDCHRLIEWWQPFGFSHNYASGFADEDATGTISEIRETRDHHHWWWSLTISVDDQLLRPTGTICQCHNHQRCLAVALAESLMVRVTHVKSASQLQLQRKQHLVAKNWSAWA